MQQTQTKKKHDAFPAISCESMIHHLTLTFRSLRWQWFMSRPNDL